MKIIQMPDALANKIAAGEVVERPASVVKELVENSIDANSTWIKIEVQEAGLQQVKITDNGDGMSEDDCERAFLPHATSKIKYETDLFHVKTLGFRGEALASIAAVSMVTLKSSQGEQAGAMLTLEGGTITSKTKSDARKGTEITVDNLFYNTPARLKYMKTIHTELGHITDLLNRLALSHPDIRFEAYHNGKSLFTTSGSGDVLHVISQVYGMGTARKMIPIKHETLDFSIEGYIAKPEITRASRNYISTIINGRYIKSIPLSQAIIRGYHTLLPINRYPIVVLSIRMDPVLVDVNVHPTKLEVRFSKDKELFEALEETIRTAFRKTTLIPEAGKSQKQQPSGASVQHSMQFDEAQPEKDSQPKAQELPSQVKETSTDWESSTMTVNASSEDVKRSSDAEAEKSSANMEKEPEEEPVQQQSTTRTSERIPIMYPIGQVHGTYILAQNETGLYMIDQHAAQERIKYEFFKQKLGQTVNESQELLLPLTFEFSQQEAIFIEHHKQLLEEVGLFLEPFGTNSYIIRSYPTWFPKGLEEEIIREMVDQIIGNEQIDVEKIREEAAILMSCKRSIKANHYLNQEDMFRLLEDLRKSTDPFTCPHGRPIIVHFTSYELEKMFKRVM